MNNITVSESLQLHVSDNIIAYCADSDNGLLYLLKSDYQIIKIDIRSNPHESQLIDYTFDESSKSTIRLFEFIVQTGTILVAFSSGHIFMIGVSTYSPPSECVYRHEAAISCVRTSPDQDLIALSDEDNELFILNSDHSVLFRSNALRNNKSLHKPVGVGWGSKETQFFGLDGRPSKERQTNDKVVLTQEELNTKSTIEASDIFRAKQDERNISTIIDWRGDGQLLATLTYIPEFDKHYVKVWNRNLELQYMSEQLITVQRGIISWVPNGKYICCTQRRDECINDIAMFEKNGMIHERLTLPTIMKHLYIEKLCWSSNSKILAIIANEYSIVNDKVQYKPILMLYTIENFKYYLKYSTYLAPDCTHELDWDPIIWNRIRIISNNGLYIEYECNLGVTISEEYSTVAVIDANRVLLTPMDKCNIPPPMFAISIEIDKLIKLVHLDPYDAANISISTIDDEIILSDDSGGITSDRVKVSLEIKTSNSLYSRLQKFKFQTCHKSIDSIITRNQSCLLAIKNSHIGSEIVKMNLADNIPSSISSVKHLQSRRILSIARPSKENINSLQVILDDLKCFIMDTQNFEHKEIFEFVPSVQHSRLTFISTRIARVDDKDLLISLGQDLTLRVNEISLVSNTCTSFYTTKNYLIYTTSDNYLNFMLLSDINSPPDRSPSNSWSQPIENGGLMVLASEEASKVTLLMPRGNLEILRPRVLVLSLITALLNERNYAKALLIARKNRVDTNFLCDYLIHGKDIREQEAQQLISELVCGIGTSDFLTLGVFINELKNENTILERYASIMPYIPDNQIQRVGKSYEMSQSLKVNSVCDIIENLGDKIAFGPRLMSYLRREPPKIAEGLGIIKTLDEESQRQGLKIMQYYNTPIETLFNEALKVYDFDAALMVASLSNKDPKQYLNLLEGFKSYPDGPERHFEIDIYTHNYTKALENLILIINKSSDKEPLISKFMDLMLSKRLYNAALSLLTETNTPTHNELLLKNVWSSFGQYLLEKRYHLESGFAFSKASQLSPADEGLLNSALKSYDLAGDWSQSWLTIERSQVGDSIKRKALDAISKRLLKNNPIYEWLSVSRIDTSKSLTEAEIDELIMRGRNWHLLEILAKKTGDTEFGIRITPMMTRMIETSKDLIYDSCKTAMERYDRLKLLMKANEDKNASQMNVRFVSDTLSTVDGSEVSSVSGSGRAKQQKSGASSIKTKKQWDKRIDQTTKRISLKEGSKYEDIAIILELQKYIQNWHHDLEYYSDLIMSAHQYMGYNRASSILQEFKKLLEFSRNFCDQVSDSLWPVSGHTGSEYSIYNRYIGNITKEQRYHESDFLIFLKPQVAKEVALFSINWKH